MTTTPQETLTVDEAAARASGAAAAVAAAALETRASWLEAVADAVDANADELIALADAETHLGRPRLPGELARTTAQLRLFATVVRDGGFLEATIDHPDPSATPPIPDLRRILIPLGPVAVFAASNFPFAFSVLGGDTASALAAGNPVVVKAHEGHPELSRRTYAVAAEALAKAGAPDGILGLVEGREEGVELVRDERIAAVGFTGSVAGGRFLFDVASSRPKPIPFYGELGSLNPVVITEAAVESKLDEIVTGLAGSFTMGCGQFCTKPGVVFAPASVDLAGLLTGAASTTAAPMLNGRIAHGFREMLTRVASNAQVTASGPVPDAGSDDPTAAPIVLTTTVDAVLAEPEALLEEVFGPATLIVRYDDAAQVTEALRKVPGSLTATIHAADDEDVSDLITVMTEVSGRVLFGGWPTGVAVSWAQHHGGPYPSTTSVHTSVGTTAIRRFLRPVAYQTVPDRLLPLALQEANPLGIPRRVDGGVVLPS
jgi:NADP-dependent aldehyde dehydrogenase